MSELVASCSKKTRCPFCKLERETLKQTRSGSMSARCTICCRSFKLLLRDK